MAEHRDSRSDPDPGREPDPRNEQYERARRAFEDLHIEDRAVFLLQETIATVAHGIEAVGKVMADGLEAALRRPEEGPDEPSPPEPPTPAPPSKQARTKKTSPKGSGEDTV